MTMTSPRRGDLRAEASLHAEAMKVWERRLGRRMRSLFAEMRADTLRKLERGERLEWPYWQHRLDRLVAESLAEIHGRALEVTGRANGVDLPPDLTDLAEWRRSRVEGYRGYIKRAFDRITAAADEERRGA